MKSFNTIYSVLTFLSAVSVSVSSSLLPGDEIRVLTAPTFLSVSSILTETDSSVRIICPVEHHPGQVVTWLKNGAKVAVGNRPDTENHFGDQRLRVQYGSLKISPVRLRDRGLYTCQLPATRLKRAPRRENVKAPSIIVPERAVITPKEGDTVNLECHTEGNPPPRIKWFKKDSDKLLNQDLNLTLVNVSRLNSGVYQCVADNGVGEPARAQIEVIVIHAPIVEVTNFKSYGQEGYPIVLSCMVKSYPLSKVTWYRIIDEKDAPVNPTRLKRGFQKVAYNELEYTLHFDKVFRDDYGKYRCLAANPLGNSSGVITLTGEPGPMKIVSENLSKYSTQYTLSWEITSYAPILYYVVTLKNLTDSDAEQVKMTVPSISSLYSNYYSQIKNLTGLQPNTTYVSNVQAFNEFGMSKLATPFIFFTSSQDRINGNETYDYYDESTESSAYEYESSFSDRLEQTREMTDTENGTSVVSSAPPHRMSPSDRHHFISHLITVITLSVFFF